MNGRSSSARLAAAAFVLLLAGGARAQNAPEVQVGVDSETVGVGDTVRVELIATSSDAMPSDPQVGATPGFVLRGQSASPAQTHISFNGNRMDRYTLTVDWTLQATKTGIFSVGPPTVVVGGARFAARPVTLHVVPAGQAPARRRPQAQQPFAPFPFQFSPFDPWRGMMPPDVDQAPAEAAPPATDPKLALDAPRGQLYFLHATLDKPAAVVGEPVIFSVYEYIDTSATGLEVDDADVHDAQVADFVKRQLLKEEEAPLSGYASIGGRTWAVKLVRRWALFPLHAGDLVVGPMSVGLSRPRALAGAKRASEALHVRVAEPPLQGRPPGYATGDVGRFTLSAQVQPRQAEQGGAVSVHVDVSGKGNVPNAIAVPSREGVEWLEPANARATRPHRAGRVRGHPELRLHRAAPAARQRRSRRAVAAVLGPRPEEVRRRHGEARGREGEPFGRGGRAQRRVAARIRRPCLGCRRRARRSRARSHPESTSSTRCGCGSGASPCGRCPSERPWCCAQRRGASLRRGEAGARRPRRT